jgi:hypothetical protein
LLSALKIKLIDVGNYLGTILLGASNGPFLRQQIHCTLMHYKLFFYVVAIEWAFVVNTCYDITILLWFGGAMSSLINVITVMVSYQ